MLDKISNLIRESYRFNVLNVDRLKTSGNLTFLIKTDSNKYVLRLCGESLRFRTKEEIAAEIELLELLQKNNFPSPKPITNKQGGKIVSLGERNGILYEFLEGENIADHSLQECQQVGNLLGWLHTLTLKLKPKHERKRWDLEATKYAHNELRQAILDSNLKRKQEFLEKISAELSKLNFPESLPNGFIHEDLGKRHVLFKDNKIVGVLDFDRSYSGPLVLDLGQALRGWCFDNWKTWNKDKFLAFMKGYENQRNISDAEKAVLKDAIKFGILERALSYAVRFVFSENKEDEEFALHSVFNLIEELDQHNISLYS